MTEVQTRAAPKGHGVREEILAAALALVQRQGFRKTTIDDVARAMGRERSWVYYYFPGKQELVGALVDGEFSKIARAVRVEVEQQKDAAGRLRAYMAGRTQAIAAHCALYEQTLPELRAAGDFYNLASRRRLFDEGEQRYFADIIQDGVRTGQFRSLSEAEIIIFTRFAFSAIRGIELDLMLDGGRVADLKAQIQLSLNLLFRGLLAD